MNVQPQRRQLKIEVQWANIADLDWSAGDVLVVGQCEHAPVEREP